MPAATVLVPTHDNGATLRYSVGSALAQSMPDFELFIVGDGVPVESRKIADELCERDRRVRFFDFPKGPRRGEAHLHAALAHASGRIVAYLGDDDLWLPNHLLTLDGLLSTVDFGHTLNVGLDSRGQLAVYPADLANRQHRLRMLEDLFNRFDFTFAGHTLDAYARLPEGWSTTPGHFPWVDLYMWRKFLAQPWCRTATAMVPTGICMRSTPRVGRTAAQRKAELARWSGKIRQPGFGRRFQLDVIAATARYAVERDATLYDRDRLAAQSARNDERAPTAG